MWRTAYLTLLLLLFCACQKSENRSCVKGRGESATESRDLALFDKVAIYDYIDYIFIQDSTDRVVIRTGENLMNRISTEVKDGRLTIRDDNKCHWLRKLPVEIEVVVHFTGLKEFYSASSGDVTAALTWLDETIDVDIADAAGNYDLTLESQVSSVQIHGGFPVVNVTGSADMVFYYNNSTGRLLAEPMQSVAAWVDNKSSGEIRCTVEGGTLWYMLDGSGNTYYRGIPSNLEEVSKLGTGELIYLD
jgi:hypothetical protein